MRTVEVAQKEEGGRSLCLLGDCAEGGQTGVGATWRPVGIYYRHALILERSVRDYMFLCGRVEVSRIGLDSGEVFADVSDSHGLGREGGLVSPTFLDNTWLRKPVISREKEISVCFLQGYDVRLNSGVAHVLH